MNLFIFLALFLWILATGLNLLSTWWARAHFKKTPPHLDAPFRLYPVSILKPLKGADFDLEANLRSFFSLDYPLFELLFSVADFRDPALGVIQRLMREYLQVPARLFVGDVEAGANPKVNNLVRSYQSAMYDWVLISDSNVRISPDGLKRMVAHLSPGVGVVTSVIAGRNAEGLGGSLEASYLNTFYARGMLFLNALGRAPVVGKSMLFQRSMAERFGGMKTLSRYLAEDYMAGQAMRRLNLRTVVAADPVEQNLGRLTIKTFWMRHLRWGRIRKAQAPLAFALEPFLGCIVSGLLGALALREVLGFSFLTVALFHLIVWSLCDFSISRKLEPEPKVYYSLIWFLRELLVIPLWINIALGNTVQWRGRELKVLPGGILDSGTFQK